MELEELDAICTEICASQNDGWIELSSSQAKSLNDSLLNSFTSKTPETRTTAILWFVKFWTLPKDRIPNSRLPLKRRRSKNQHTLEEFCIAFFESLLETSGEAAFDLCQGLATGVNTKLKWENGEAMILCLDTLLFQSSQQWADQTSLGLLPILLPASEHRSMNIRRIFFSTVFNAGRFLLMDNPSPDVFLQRIYPLMEQGLNDKNATIRMKLHSHLSEMIELVAFQDFKGSGFISILYRLWSFTLRGMLDISKSVRSRTLETVKRVIEGFLMSDKRRNVVFTWLHHLHGDLISLLIQQLIVIIIARPDSSLALKTYQKMAQEVLCVLIKIPLFQAKMIEGGLASRSPLIQSVIKEALAGIPGSVLLEQGVQWIQEINRIDAEERIKAFIRMLPDVHLNALNRPSRKDWSLIRICLQNLHLLCTDPPSTRTLTQQKILNLILSIKSEEITLCRKYDHDVTVVYTSIKREKIGIEEIRVLSILERSLLVLMDLGVNNWNFCLMYHWILQTFKIIFKRQQRDQIIDQSCQSLLKIYLKHQSYYPCLIQSDFIETILMSSATGILLLSMTGLRALKGHHFLNVLTTLHRQKQRLERNLRQVPSISSDVLDWIFSLAFSSLSPLFIQFQAIRILIELTSIEPSLINSIVEMIVKTLESDQSNERNSWMCRIGIFASNKLIKIAPDSHKNTLSSLIVPLCHYIPEQREDMQSFAFSILGRLCLQFGMLGGFLTDSLLIKTMINGLISTDIHVKEIVQHVLERVFQMDSKRIPRLLVELFYQVDVGDGVILSRELLVLWRSFQQSTDAKCQMDGNPSHQLLILYFDFEQPSMKDAILSLLFHIKPTPQSLTLLLDHWTTHGDEVAGLKGEDRAQWIQFCLNYGPPVQNKDESHRTKQSDLGSRIQSELLLILQPHSQLCDKSTGRKHKSEKECPSVIVQEKELANYAERIEVLKLKE